MATDRGVGGELVRIILAAPMKSASTYVGNALRHYFQVLDPPELTHVPFLTEHNISPWLIHDVRGRSFCFNFHMMPHASNLIAADEESISIVVLWRNISDMLVSYDDHQFGEEAGNAALFYVMDHARYCAADAQERYAFLIDTLAPWYIGFYARWRGCDVVLHPYEQLLLDKRGYFYDILIELLGHPPVEEYLAATLETKPGRVSRFNVGGTGRSAERFSGAIKRRLEDKILSHPDREQLEILLWELPWEVPALKSDRPLDGKVVRVTGEAVPFFVTSGRAHPILRPSWLACRYGDRRFPLLVTSGELADYAPGEALI
jgi:hypothetical protein